MFAFLSSQPTHFEEVVKEKHLVAAMNQEIATIEKNETWELVDLPRGKTKISVKWVYKTMLNENIRQCWFPKDSHNNLVSTMVKPLS